tara:strand:+ start:614 stop:1624 length:1011 start_codon:yes stop_codon:yes gene_type:complete
MEVKKTIVIAEAGVNHNGSLDIAKRMVDIAKDCGADYIKFQTFKAQAIATSSASKADYQKQSLDEEQTQLEMLKQLELKENDYLEILDYCSKISIKCFSTGFDIESLKFLESTNQELYKIPSGEITNLPYIEYIGSLNREVILSTGISSMDEVSEAFTALLRSGLDKDKISILHCTSQYPADIYDLNLNAIKTLKEKFNVRVGYSDHTQGIHIATAAVSLGARIIEKHFTVDKSLPGPDHETSIEANELKTMISNIKDIDLALGEGKKMAMPGELKNISMVRKSIVAKTDIKAGDIFSEENITCKRPALGISPMKWYEVIGRKSPSSFVVDDLIKL